MPKRILIANSIYHVFNRGNHKNKIYFEQSDYSHFRKLMFRLHKDYTFQIYSYCFMPNHFHLLINVGSNPKEFPKYMHRFMTAYAKYINKKYNLVGRLFQSPYKTRYVTEERGLKMVMEYIKQNPVEAGFVTEIDHYKWYQDLSLGGKKAHIEGNV